MSEANTTSTDERPPTQADAEDDERALRVSQLDADELDTGLVQMLTGKIIQALSAFSVSLISRKEMCDRRYHLI